MYRSRWGWGGSIPPSEALSTQTPHGCPPILGLAGGSRAVFTYLPWTIKNILVWTPRAWAEAGRGLQGPPPEHSRVPAAPIGAGRIPSGGLMEGPGAAVANTTNRVCSNTQTSSSPSRRPDAREPGVPGLCSLQQWSCLPYFPFPNRTSPKTPGCCPTPEPSR